MHRSAPRLTRILACAAVPVMLVVAGCSSDSDSASKGSASSASAAPEAKKSPTVAPARFSKLPSPCDSITEKTIEDLVPGTKSKNGTAGKSSDIARRGSCSWNGLDDNGVKGSQYRWLDVSFLRYDSDASLAVSGEQRAVESYAKEIAKAKGTEGAKDVKTSPAPGVGDEATTVNYTLRKTDEDFTYATIVARTENGVVTLTYNGTGYAGAKNPSAADLTKAALKAAKEAVASVATANK
ncbi:DUF3558 domain-containing protein [Streptomyces sp. Tu 2975]|uniref:DUF3558 domain-containing protein n=1 Tax=Streptomyces sp. Tu 2975 TaxID=2676871 RepID=UPI00135A0F4B|nr:DUF3558 domain-containing protein [Streptomyces sp. Tu 2975]QIP85280.1 DUF3558 domain-containing protein [Streptomyces sp. Tu 2975]